MSIMFWDLSLLSIFVIFISIFLYKKRKNLKKEGLLLLYHTKWGIKLINRIGKKYEKTLKILSYVSVFIGYALMVFVIYFFIKILIVYFFKADLVRAIKIPPITPLIPYLPQIFKLDFLPPLYFSYWIIILAIVTITHEFFHGIFAKIANIKIKTTGFGFFPFFFPVFLAAFVNLDEKAMSKKTNFKQRAVLSAGTFANIITTLIGVLLMWGIFVFSFTPMGVIYDDYAYGVVNVSQISSINGINLTNPTYQTVLNLTSQGKSNKIIAKNETFFGIRGVSPKNNKFALYYDSPAIENSLKGVITKINGEKIDSLDKLSSVIGSYNVGENLTITTYDGEKNYNTQIILENSPYGDPWIGVTFFNKEPSGLMGKISSFFTSYKDSNIYYSPNFSSAKYIYDLFWWLVLISFSLALLNMLPLGILDGGRFFYLTILAITKSEEKAKKAFKFSTLFFLALIGLLMVFWAKAFF